MTRPLTFEYTARPSKQSRGKMHPIHILRRALSLGLSYGVVIEGYHPGAIINRGFAIVSARDGSRHLAVVIGPSSLTWVAGPLGEWIPATRGIARPRGAVARCRRWNPQPPGSARSSRGIPPAARAGSLAIACSPRPLATGEC